MTAKFRLTQQKFASAFTKFFVCLDGSKTDGNHKKDNRMITEFGQ